MGVIIDELEVVEPVPDAAEPLSGDTGDGSRPTSGSAEQVAEAVRLMASRAGRLVAD